MSEPSQGRSLPWYRVDVDLVDHPKVAQLAERLEVSEAEAGWAIIRLWSWTMRYAARGRLAPGARTALGRLAPVRVDGARFVDGLVSAGWLDEIDDGGWEVHDWAEHNGAAVAKAEKDAERKRMARARRGDGAETARRRRADGAGNGTERNGTERNVDDERDHPPPPLVDRSPGPLVFVEPTTPSHTWSPRDFFAWAQAVRQSAGWVAERWPRKDLGRWWSEVQMTPGMEPHREGVDRLRAGFLAFARDSHWREAKPPVPFQAFMSVWRDHVPAEVPGARVAS